MIDLFESLFFILSSIITLENILRLFCIIIGVIYTYIKYRFKLIYMPSYLYEYEFNESDLKQEMYNNIISNYATSIFIITIIEGMLISALLQTCLISPSISIEIPQSRGYVF